MEKLIKRAVLFVCIFAVLSVAVTYAGIRRAKKAAVPESQSPENIGIDLYGTYDQNDLLIQESVESYCGVEIKIPRIDGLKDTEVQDKINQDMYGRVQEFLAGYTPVTYADFDINANFANVFSITFYVVDDTNLTKLHLNYNLVDGERLVLPDLFSGNTDLTQIVRNAFYNMLALSGQYDYDKSKRPVFSPDENELYKIVKGYFNSADPAFWFTPAEIGFYYQDSAASVKMVDIAKDVAVYSEFMTDESLYTRDDIGHKDIFTCADIRHDHFRKLEYGYMEPNLWYEIAALGSFQEEEPDAEITEAFTSFEESIYSAVEQKITEYRETAKNNPDKFYIVFAKPNVYLHSRAEFNGEQMELIYTDIATVNKRITIFEMPMNIYETVYKDKLIDTYRYDYFSMRGGAFLERPENDGATMTTFSEDYYCNFRTGEQFTDMGDIIY